MLHNKLKVLINEEFLLLLGNRGVALWLKSLKIFELEVQAFSDLEKPITKSRL